MVESEMVSPESRICFVDDGSTDSTWSIIQNLAKEDSRFCGVSLSRNCGHQNALLCGLMEALDQCDVAISLDCDGQDDVRAARLMVNEYLNGADIVYGVRGERDTDGMFKRMSAHGFYKLLEAMGVESVFDHADYRLMSKRSLESLAEFREKNLYLRGVVPMLGYKTAKVSYKRAARVAGKSHYSLDKMISLAENSITGLTTKPLQIISKVGILFSLIGLIGTIWTLACALMGTTIAGWASLSCFVCFLGGLQLLSLGVIGTYIGQIFLEVKDRPRYFVSDRTWE